MFKLLTIIILASNLIGCKDDSTVPLPHGGKSKILGKKTLERQGLTSTSHYYNGNIIFGHPAKDVNNYLVYSLDADNGDSLWVTRIATPFEFDPFNGESTLVNGNKMVLADAKRMFVLNADNGKILWNYTDPANYSGICIIDDFIYIADIVNRTSSTLYRFDINSGTKQALFTMNSGPDEPGRDFTPYLMMPVKWIHPNGDEVLVLQNRSYGHDKIGPDGKYGYFKMDLMAYNLTADSILWYRYELENYSSGARPAISGDKVYFYGDHHAYCIHAGTGETLWKYFIGNGPEDDFNTANVLLIGDKLIVKPDNDHMHAVNKETGERIWLNEYTASMPGLLTVHNDTIWFSSGGILAIDANTGETLIDQWNNDDRGSWIFPVCHHPEKPWIYTSDASYFYCLDIRKLK